MSYVGPQRLYFIRREFAPLARYEFTEAKGALAHPYQTPYFIAEQLRNLANLSLAAFAHDDADPYAVGGALLHLYPSRHRHLAVQLYAVAPAAQIVYGRRPIEQHTVLFLDLEARMGQPVG